MRHAHKEKWNDKRKAAENKALERVEQKTAEIVADNATLLERIKTGLLQKLAVMVENFPSIGAGEMRRREADGTELIYRMRDIAAIYETLQDKLPKGQATDIEDLSPLVELLKDE